MLHSRSGSVRIARSLTVAALDEPPGTLRLALIPHTWEKTTAAGWAPGQAVNLEFDFVGKYVVRSRHVSQTPTTD